MGFSLGDVTGAIGDLGGAAFDLVDAAGNLAEQAAPIAGLLNPAAGLTLSSFSMGANVIDGLTKGIMERHENDEHGEHDHRGGGKGGCHSKGGADAGGGGSIFEQIAIAMGKAMDKKLDQLLDAANTVSDLSNQKADGGGKGGQTDPSQLLQASALVTARGQELSSVSQAFNSSINSLGQAVQTAARKS